MKTLKYIFLLSIMVSFFSCDKEPIDDTGIVVVDDTDTDTDPTTYFPSNSENEWNYDVVNVDNTTDTTTNSTDRLFIESETGASFVLGVNDDGIANGTKNGLLVNGTMAQTKKTLSTTGELSLPFGGVDISIPYSNAVLYNIDAPDNTALSSFTGTIEETIQDFPLKVVYVLTTKQITNHASIELNGEMYENVTQSNLTLNLQITTSIVVFGMPLELPIVKQSDVLISNNYYAAGIGLVRSESNVDFVIEDIPGGTDGSDIPSNVSTINIQELATYTNN